MNYRRLSFFLGLWSIGLFSGVSLSPAHAQVTAKTDVVTTPKIQASLDSNLDLDVAITPAVSRPVANTGNDPSRSQATLRMTDREIQAALNPPLNPEQEHTQPALEHHQTMDAMSDPSITLDVESTIADEDAHVSTVDMTPKPDVEASRTHVYNSEGTQSLNTSSAITQPLDSTDVQGPTTTEFNLLQIEPTFVQQADEDDSLHTKGMVPTNFASSALTDGETSRPILAEESQQPQVLGVVDQSTQDTQVIPPQQHLEHELGLEPVLVLADAADTNQNCSPDLGEDRRLPERIQLFYFRNLTELKAIVEKVVPGVCVHLLQKHQQSILSVQSNPESKVANQTQTNQASTTTTNGQVTQEESKDNTTTTTTATVGETQITTRDDVVLLVGGDKEDRRDARRVIAALDLPRPGIELQMWGIEISSDDSQDLSKVMRAVRKEINQTQQLIQESYGLLIGEVSDFELVCSNNEFVCRARDLGYVKAFDNNRPLAPSDILMRLVAAEGKGNQFTADLANRLRDEMQNDRRGRYAPYLDSMRELDQVPFERFFYNRGLEVICKNIDPLETSAGKKRKKDKKSACIDNYEWVERGSLADRYAQTSRTAILDFGAQYAQFILNRNGFSSYSLQQSSDVLNGRLQKSFNAFNRDIEDFFMLPTLNRIQKIVSKFGDVEFAQVGRTTISGLSGVDMYVSTTVHSTFESTPPLTLSTLLRNAVPLGAPPPAANQPANGAADMPASGGTPTLSSVLTSLGLSTPTLQLISLIGGLGEDRAVWRQLGLSRTLALTPKVLRNMTSAELTFNLTVPGPNYTDSSERGSSGRSLRPLSRISAQEVQTSIYVDAIDLFAFSTFSNQNTIDGGRGYFPLIGPVWRGLFGEIPVIGKLFSWKRGPQNVRHESLLLTNSYITPTVMGLALLYPIEIREDEKCNLLKNINQVFQMNVLTTENSIKDQALACNQESAASSQAGFEVNEFPPLEPLR